jgi:hypothetical protein
MSNRQFASDAWLLKGLTRSIPGWLELHQDRLRFVTPGEVVFDEPRSRVSAVTYPWYYFGGGVKLRIGDARYRISFVKPNGAETAIGRGLGEMGNPAALYVAATKVTDIRAGRAVGRRWRELLGDS